LIFVQRHWLGRRSGIFLSRRSGTWTAALEESARMCGASPRRTVTRILVPLLRPAILAASFLSLTRLLASFETEVSSHELGNYVLTNKIYEG